MEEQTPAPVPVTKLYAYNKKAKRYLVIGYQCGLCNATWVHEKTGERHPYLCKKNKKPWAPSPTS